ncbi:MAG: STAS/SEC14 domain-containing protein [Flavobacterium sp.]|nr:STAS/SEC14 domain-containing protein [Flavobacterium sp.]
MKKYATIDSSNYPTIKVIFTGEQGNDDNFPFYMQEVKAVYEQQNKVVIMFDATNAVIPALKYQKMQGDWLKENEQLMKDYCLGTAYIIPNLIIRNVLKAIFTFQKQPVAYLVCKTMNDAEFWTKEQLNNDKN